jgi:retron-type reverse transcriptase
VQFALTVPAVRDRVAQEVLRRLLHPIFEPRFHEASFGFRPGRNGHQALALAMKYHDEGLGVVLDADVVGCLDPYSYYTLAVEGWPKGGGLFV